MGLAELLSGRRGGGVGLGYVKRRGEGIMGEGQNLQTRSSLPSRPKTLPPFSAPLLVIVRGMGCSTTLD